MAGGLCNKIKQGFKKVGNFVKKAASFVNDKVIKPFKPVITNVANAIVPGSGRIVTSNDEVEYRSSAPSATFVYIESGTATLTVYKEGSAISADESYI